MHWLIAALLRSMIASLDSMQLLIHPMSFGIWSAVSQRIRHFFTGLL
jgi:hypothetical protein